MHECILWIYSTDWMSVQNHEMHHSFEVDDRYHSFSGILMYHHERKNWLRKINQLHSKTKSAYCIDIKLRITAYVNSIWKRFPKCSNFFFVSFIVKWNVINLMLLSLTLFVVHAAINVCAKTDATTNRYTFRRPALNFPLNCAIQRAVYDVYCSRIREFIIFKSNHSRNRNRIDCCTNGNEF